MSGITATALSPVWPRAALVLLVTLLAHALLFDRVQRLLAEGPPAASSGAPTVQARLLAPPVIAPPVASPSPAAPIGAVAPRAAPRPRPKPAAKPPLASESLPPIARAPEVAWPASAPAADEAELAAPSAGEPASRPDGIAQDEPRDAAADVQAARSPGTDDGDMTARAFEAEGPELQRALQRLPSIAAALPPQARYVYRTTYSETSLAGTTVVEWSVQDERYRLRMATTTLGFTAIELESQGAMRGFGLAPWRYVETRIRRGAVAANFDWDARRVTFSARTHERPLPDGVQDRISFQFQLMLIGQAMPERFRAGAETVLRIAGRDDVNAYRFRALGRETVATGIGELDTVRIERLDPDSPRARIDVWLAPDRGWLPVRLRFTDRHGRSIESLLESGVPA